MTVAPDIAGLLAQLQGGQQAEQGPPDAVSHSDAIRELLDLAREVAAAADDDQEMAQLEQVTSILAKLLAAQQKQDEDAAQGKLSPGAVRRALG